MLLNQKLHLLSSFSHAPKIFPTRFFSSDFDNPVSSKNAPPRFVRYLNGLSHDLEYCQDESPVFLLHCPYLALRWNLVNIFVRYIDRWLYEITRPRNLNRIKSADSIPYVLFSLVRLHNRWTSLISSSSPAPTNNSKTSKAITLLDDPTQSPWSMVIYRSEFGSLIDQMVDIGFHQCHVHDLAKSCMALRYFVQNVTHPSGTSTYWPSQAWLSELMSWICSRLKEPGRSDHARSHCDSTIGPILLATLCQFDDLLPAGQYELVLRILADLSKEKFRDFIAEARTDRRSRDQRSIDTSDQSKKSPNRRSITPIIPSYRLCSIMPSPQIFLDYSSAWLSWRIDPDDRDLVPGSWRVWYEALYYASFRYAEIGRREGLARNSFVSKNGPLFSKLLIDMVTVSRLFEKEQLFASTGAKATWEQWAMLSAFYCKPEVAEWLLHEMRVIEEICLIEKGPNTILPKEFMRPELRRHLEFLAGRNESVETIE